MRMFSILLGLLSGLLFGTATPLSKVSLSVLNSFQLAGLLYIGSALAFTPYVIANKRDVLLTLAKTGKAKHVAGIVLFGGLLGPLFLMLGLKTALSMSVSIWLNLELAATAILGVLVFKEHIDKFSLIGIIFTLIAGILISYQEESSGFLSGLFVLAACICWGVDNQLTSIVDGITPQTTTFIKGLFGGSVNLCIGMMLGNESISAKYICAALIIGIISYGISIYFYITSAQNLGATKSQVLFSTSPFWGIAIAFIFLKEPVTTITVVAVIILCIGIFFSNIPSHNHTHAHHRITHIHMHIHSDGHHNHVHEIDPDLHNKHTHEHTHEEIIHTHEHNPDIQHRHTHKNICT